MTVGGLVGQGARAFPVILDINADTASNTVTIPLLKKIMHCRTTLEINLLSVGAEDRTKSNGEELTVDAMTPTLTMTTPRRASARIHERSMQMDEAADEATDKATEETNQQSQRQKPRVRRIFVKNLGPLPGIHSICIKLNEPSGHHHRGEK